jgi:Peptidase A4 family
MLRNRIRLSLPPTSRPRHAATGLRSLRRSRPSVEQLEGRLLLTAGDETWVPSPDPSQPFSFGLSGWVPVNFGNGTYAEVDTSGDNGVDPGYDVWILSSDPSHPFAYGPAGWVPIGFGNGSYAVVDTSGDNSVDFGLDVWYLSTDQTHPFAFGSAGFVPVALGYNTYAAVDTTGYNPVAHGNDVWYFSTNQSDPIGYGLAGWVPVGLGNDTYAAVDTSGNNPVYPGADIWYPSTNSTQPFAYGAAGLVPVGYGTSAYAVVDESGASGAAPVVPPNNPIWSGYAVNTLADAVDDVRGAWIVPTVSGGESAFSSTWVGIDGNANGNDGSRTVEQTGTEEDLIGGVAGYRAWYEMAPGPEIPLSRTTYPVNPGDLMTGEVTYVGDDNFNVDISDLGNNGTYLANHGTYEWNFNFSPAGPSDPTRSSAEWIEEASQSPGTQMTSTLPNFGSVTFSNMEVSISGGTMPVNTGNIDDQGNTDALWNMSDPSGGSAVASQLNAAGNGFTVRYNASAGTPPPPTTGPFIPYFGPMLPSSIDTSTAVSARALVSPSPISPVGTVVGVPSLIPLSTAIDLPAQGTQPGTDPFAMVIGRKLPNQGSHRPSFSSLLSSEDGSQGN